MREDFLEGSYAHTATLRRARHTTFATDGRPVLLDLGALSIWLGCIDMTINCNVFH